MANDTDPESNPLTASVVAQPANGTVTVNGDGSFTYTPTQGFNGSDSFTYRANDGTNNSNVGTVSITVTPLATNNAPVAINDGYTVVQNAVLTRNAAQGVLANDTDPESNPLTASVVAQPASGTVTVNGDGSFTYTPTQGFNGSDSFTYRANDGTNNSNVGTVSITVTPLVTNNAPVANNDSYSVAQNAVLTRNDVLGVLANDVDAEGSPLTVSIVDQPAHGSVTLNSNGSFTYTPTQGFSGSDSFTYRANDGTSNSNLATVSITVTVVNLPFGPVTTGSFTAAGLLGIRTDLVVGAPPITTQHVDGDVDYTGYSNPPTYGNHHGFDPGDTDSNPGITPRVTGIYTTEQPEEDLIHNLEHGHVWISYKPSLMSAGDLATLQQFVRDGTTSSANGGGVGVILTPREGNDAMISMASWARLLNLNTLDLATIRSFIVNNRGKAPEGFITP